MSNKTKGTRVDLGDDLLGTRTIPFGEHQAPPKDSDSSAPADSVSAPVDTVEELLLNSKILFSEGMLGDSKRTLRRVLRMDPANLTARDRLDEIQRIEIKRILGQDEGSNGGGFVRPKKKPVEAALEDGDSVAAALERELGSMESTEDRFFEKGSNRGEFLANLDALCAGATASDRIDLGIGFLEMEFYDVALHLFRAAATAEPSARRARALVATTWIAKGNGFEAMIEVEPLIADQDSPPEEKVDYGYLAGRAQELLQNYDTAVRWYRAVIQIEPGYRDSEERMRRSLKMIHAKRLNDA